MEKVEWAGTPAPIVQVVADLDDGTRPAGVGVGAGVLNRDPQAAHLWTGETCNRRQLNLTSRC